MTAEELVDALKEEGFHYLSTSECLRHINDCYLLDICEGEDWPFLEGTAKGVAPLEIADLRTIDYVLNLTQEEKLDPMRPARITDDWNPNLAESGTPSLYYLREGKTVHVFPVSTTDELEVAYRKVPEALSGAAEPLSPKRFHSLIVDGARARAYKPSDDWELKSAARADFDSGLQTMRESLLNMQHDQSDDYVVVEDPAALH